mmetsp:Transcript_10494/g.32596  ORF Transcript_10494/g.32596 Transcript_10494/m.32596 type:complete len:371 (-) Transcript_10494:1476-2588(-)
MRAARQVEDPLVARGKHLVERGVGGVARQAALQLVEELRLREPREMVAQRRGVAHRGVRLHRGDAVPVALQAVGLARGAVDEVGLEVLPVLRGHVRGEARLEQQLLHEVERAHEAVARRVEAARGAGDEFVLGLAALRERAAEADARRDELRDDVELFEVVRLAAEARDERREHGREHRAVVQRVGRVEARRVVQLGALRDHEVDVHEPVGLRGDELHAVVHHPHRGLCERLRRDVANGERRQQIRLIGAVDAAQPLLVVDAEAFVHCRVDLHGVGVLLVLDRQAVGDLLLDLARVLRVGVHGHRHPVAVAGEQVVDHLLQLLWGVGDLAQRRQPVEELGRVRLVSDGDGGESDARVDTVARPAVALRQL